MPGLAEIEPGQHGGKAFERDVDAHDAGQLVVRPPHLPGNGKNDVAGKRHIGFGQQPFLSGGRRGGIPRPLAGIEAGRDLHLGKAGGVGPVGVADVHFKIVGILAVYALERPQRGADFRTGDGGSVFAVLRGGAEVGHAAGHVDQVGHACHQGGIGLRRAQEVLQIIIEQEQLPSRRLGKLAVRIITHLHAGKKDAAACRK